MNEREHSPAGGSRGRAPISDEPVPTPFLRVLRERREACAVQLRKCRKHCGEESVHQLRVATRRLTSHLSLLECLVPRAELKQARRLLKDRMSRLSELRDVHVQLTFIAAQVGSYPPLARIREQLERRQRKLVRKAGRRIRGFVNRKLNRWLDRVEERLAAGARSSSARRRQLKLAVRATADAFREVVQRRKQILPTEPATVHRTRIAFKKFRYMVESLSPEITGYSRRELRRLAYYQRKMGLVQDLEVLQETIAGAVPQENRSADGFEPFRKYLCQRRRRALLNFIRAADQLYTFWPPGAQPPGMPRATAR